MISGDLFGVAMSTNYLWIPLSTIERNIIHSFSPADQVEAFAELMRNPDVYSRDGWDRSPEEMAKLLRSQMSRDTPPSPLSSLLCWKPNESAIWKWKAVEQEAKLHGKMSIKNLNESLLRVGFVEIQAMQKYGLDVDGSQYTTPAAKMQYSDTHQMARAM